MRSRATDSDDVVVAESKRLGDQTGKRIIVTGATNGVGLGTARLLARAAGTRSTASRPPSAPTCWDRSP